MIFLFFPFFFFLDPLFRDKLEYQIPYINLSFLVSVVYIYRCCWFWRWELVCWRFVCLSSVDGRWSWSLLSLALILVLTLVLVLVLALWRRKKVNNLDRFVKYQKKTKQKELTCIRNGNGKSPSPGLFAFAFALACAFNRLLSPLLPCRSNSLPQNPSSTSLHPRIHAVIPSTNASISSSACINLRSFSGLGLGFIRRLRASRSRVVVLISRTACSCSRFQLSTQFSRAVTVPRRPSRSMEAERISVFL